MRTVTAAMLVFAIVALAGWGTSRAGNPLDPQPAMDGLYPQQSGDARTASRFLAEGAAIDWPPKGVENPAEGTVPDFSSKNEVCMECHSKVLKEEPRQKDIPNIHRRHLESKKTAYEGKNRDCVTCHEMVEHKEGAKKKKKEGWSAEGDVYHPNAMRAPRGVWSKLIVRTAKSDLPDWHQGVHPEAPYTFKPSLKRLVCLECHGRDSKIKTFYGAPSPVEP